MAELKIQEGQVAPPIHADSIFGSPVNTEIMDNRKIWLAFYRYASCPVCDMHFDDIVSRSHELRTMGITYVAIFESKIENFPKRLLQVKEDKFYVVADYAKSLYEQYGVEVSWPKLLSAQSFRDGKEAHKKGLRPGKIDGKVARIPAHFLLGPGGLVYKSHYGKSAGHHIPWREIKEFAHADLKPKEIVI